MKTQKGFAHAVLVIGLIVTLVGALGFIFWQNFIHKEPVATNDPVVVVERQEQVKVETPEAQTFSVDEYDIAFTVPAGLADTTIQYEARQIGAASFLAFTTKRVVDLGGDCAKGYPFGDIVTLARDQQATSEAYPVYSSEEINGYYYHIGNLETSGLSPTSTCASEVAKEDAKLLIEALKSIEPRS